MFKAISQNHKNTQIVKNHNLTLSWWYSELIKSQIKEVLAIQEG